jgi:hypothetical protein
MGKEERRRRPNPHAKQSGLSFAARSSRFKRRFEWFSLVKQAFEPRFK